MGLCGCDRGKGTTNIADGTKRKEAYVESENVGKGRRTPELGEGKSKLKSSCPRGPTHARKGSRGRRFGLRIPGSFRNTGKAEKKKGKRNWTLRRALFSRETWG